MIHQNSLPLQVISRTQFFMPFYLFFHCIQIKQQVDRKIQPGRESYQQKHHTGELKLTVLWMPYVTWGTHHL